MPALYMPLPYLNEYIVSPDGIPCRVLDVDKVDFAQAHTGRKAAETLARCAMGGELIVTCTNDGFIECEYVTNPGDAIFINLFNTGNVNMYVPGDPDGARWQFRELESRGYEFLREDFEHGGFRIKNNTVFRILHEAVAEPTCLKNAWGPGRHQFVYEGATLKLNLNGHITSIDKEAFGNTWEIVSTPRPTAQVIPFRTRGPSA